MALAVPPAFKFAEIAGVVPPEEPTVTKVPEALDTPTLVTVPKLSVKGNSETRAKLTSFEASLNGIFPLPSISVPVRSCPSRT